MIQIFIFLFFLSSPFMVDRIGCRIGGQLHRWRSANSCKVTCRYLFCEQGSSWYVRWEVFPEELKGGIGVLNFGKEIRSVPWPSITLHENKAITFQIRPKGEMLSFWHIYIRFFFKQWKIVNYCQVDLCKLFLRTIKENCIFVHICSEKVFTMMDSLCMLNPVATSDSEEKQK